MAEERGSATSPGYQFVMLVLCLYALAVLAAQSVIRLSPGTRVILDYADYVVCAIFFADFLVSLYRDKNRWQYLGTWGWLDLLSSIPMIDVARWGRIARVVRVFRVLRGLRATKLLAGMVVKRRAENTFLAASLVALLLLIFCSVAILHFESGPESNIRTPDDALWWAFATITTVGYGDRFPVTGEGRVVATILMAAGVGLFGTFSGFLAAWFLGAGKDNSGDAGLAEIRQELAALRAAVQGLGPSAMASHEARTTSQDRHLTDRT
jgi:voltage-gated potassium channel